MLFVIAKDEGEHMQLENIFALLQGDRSFLFSYKCTFSKLKKELAKKDIFMEQSPELDIKHVNFIFKKATRTTKNPSPCKISSHFSRKMIARAAAQDVKPQKMIQATTFAWVPERGSKKKIGGRGKKKKGTWNFCLNYQRTITYMTYV